MKLMVIKFEDGFRLVRTHRTIELWKNGAKMDHFATWDEAIAHLDKLAGHAVRGTLDTNQHEGPPE